MKNGGAVAVHGRFGVARGAAGVAKPHGHPLIRGAPDEFIGKIQ